jgi:predicted amidohydrolase
MRVAVLQYRPPKGDPRAGREGLAAMAEAAAAGGAKVVVAPEMATCGYIWPSRDAIAPHAEPARGATFRTLAPIAKQYGAVIVAGFPERDGRTLYNSALVVGTDGELLACYRKVLLYEADEAWATAGSQHLVVETPHGRIVPGICMDINDPGFTRHVQRAAADIVAFCTNWIEEGIDIRSYWHRRLFHRDGIILAADTWGEDSGVAFFGRSTILTRDGSIAAEAPVRGDMILFADTRSPCAAEHSA